MTRDRSGFTLRELRALRALKSPWGIQRALDAMPYHLAATAWSPRAVLREGTAHCLEGAIFAAAALRVLGHPPLLLDLEAVQDTDHVIAVFRLRGRWGAIAKSNFSGLRYREPVYRNVRELVMSYFEGYINLRGDRTLRAFSQPVNLARFDRAHPGWMVSESDLWWVAEHLVEVPHTPLLTPSIIRSLSRVDRRSLDAALAGYQPPPRPTPRTPGPRRGARGRARTSG
ncbi:MAG TPA: hypothetical protein VMI34_24950 [Candidatus Bathyarchaeia archaeon]|nr:hypothetical protein [Candidatus Bathyarchaeia archaeon]